MDRTEAIIGKYGQHPIAAELMPGGMDEDEFTAFCEDIEQRGIIMPGTLYEGKVLDGWHRYRAASKTGTVMPPWLEYKGNDPAGYIASVNVLRRRLSSLQRALVGARLHLHHGMTQRDICRKLGISNTAVNLVLRALASKNAKLIKRLEEDCELTRGGLQEELDALGLLNKKPPAETKPTGPNSVFALGAGNDTDGSKGEDEDTDDVPSDYSVGSGKQAADRAARKPKITAAQSLAEGFKALMADEKQTFLKMIWREATPFILEAKLRLPDKAPTTPLEALKKAVKPAPATKKTAKK